MISVNEARELVIKHTSPLQIIQVPISQAAHHVLAENIYAHENQPAFDQSAMDGYALKFSDIESPLHLDGEIPAGQVGEVLKAGTAQRIFTGAAVPTGADTVVMQEHTEVNGDTLIITEKGKKFGTHIRAAGSQIQQGECALPSGHFLNAASIGFLASMGLDQVPVYAKPSIRILVTGSELNEPGTVLSPGSIYESNSYMLVAALQSIGMEAASTQHIQDAQSDIINTIDRLAETADVLLLTGGVSVGDYDFVHTIQDHPSFQAVFHKVKQKPGKPFLFGKWKNTLVFGFPGNPASALTCFYIYAVPALFKMAGNPASTLEKSMLELGAAYPKKPGLTVFIKGMIEDDKAYVLGGQQSYILRSYASTSILIELDEAHGDYVAGEQVAAYHIPKYNM